jgi:hypothetical protein
MKEGSPIHVFLHSRNNFVFTTMTTYTYLNCKHAQILMLFSQIPHGSYLTWILYKLKFSHNFTCVSQGLTTVVPENTKPMHECITLVLCPESGDRWVGQVACKL